MKSEPNNIIALADYVPVQLPATQLAVPGPSSPQVGDVITFGAIIAGLFMSVLLGWSSLAPLATGAFASATVISETNRKTIKHREGGVVAKLLVRNGDNVLAGEPLLRLDTLRAQKELAALRGQVDANKDRIRLLKSEELLILSLLERKLATRSRLLSIKRRAAEVTADLFIAEGNIASVEESLHRSTVRAPVAGKVFNLDIHSVGAVINPGAPILEIVPANDRLIVEAQLSPADIDMVQMGQKSLVWISAFNRRDTPALEGRIIGVSGDKVRADNGDPGHYVVRISLDPSPEQMPMLEKLYPGMPAEALIVTQTRSLLEILFDPLMKNISRGFRSS